MRILREVRAWPLIVVLFLGFPSDVGAQANPKLIDDLADLPASFSSQDLGWPRRSRQFDTPAVSLAHRNPMPYAKLAENLGL